MYRLLFIPLILLHCLPALAQVGVNNNGAPPHPSAMLDVSSSTRGMLAPRMTASQMATVPNPATGLMVFNTTAETVGQTAYRPGFHYWTGSAWQPLGQAAPVAGEIPALLQSQIDTLPAVAGTLVLNLTSQCLNYFTGLFWMALCGNAIPPQPGSDSILYAPYADCCLWPNFAIENVTVTGILFYTLAFIVDDQTQPGATPCWGGFPTLGMDYYLDRIDSLRAQGGDVIMSFGGANGVELAYAAADEFAARAAYKTAIDAYALTSIDCDIEGMFVADPPSIMRRSKAMKLLQDEYPGLRISLTLPVMPTGLTVNGLNVVQNALTQGVDLYCVNVMAMDYGPSVIDMGDAAISAGEAVFLQLKTLYQSLGIPMHDSLVWRKIGITPMIGQNDIPGEVFWLDDAVDVANWALTRKINRLAIWSANRDRPCNAPGDPLYSCSHIPQVPYEFSGIFGAVAAGTDKPQQQLRNRVRPENR